MVIMFLKSETYPSFYSCKFLFKITLMFIAVALRSLFTKLFTAGLTCEICNVLDYWLESTSPTNHLADYLICGLTQELKIL